MNLGYIDDGDIKKNIPQGAHVEQVLLCDKYIGSGTGSWNYINEWMEKNKTSRPPFSLYTERIPCRTCLSALTLDCYTENDKVFYTFEGTSEEQKKAIEDEHKHNREI